MHKAYQRSASKLSNFFCLDQQIYNKFKSALWTSSLITLSHETNTISSRIAQEQFAFSNVPVITCTCTAPPAGLAILWFSALQFSGYCINTKAKNTSKTPVPSIFPIQNGVRSITAEIFPQSYQPRYGLHAQHLKVRRCEIQALEFQHQMMKPQIINMQHLPMKGKPLDSFTQYNS